MRGAADLAREHSAYLQTHLAENLEEIEKVRAQFTWAADYTEIYEKCGMLGPRTVLSHCIHLSPRERQAIVHGGASVAHCPTANLFLGSGVLPLDTVRAGGARVGLGSGVAAVVTVVAVLPRQPQPLRRRERKWGGCERGVVDT